MVNHVVIVRASLAGAAAAATLREEGFDRSVTLIGAEIHAPYERPALSREYLRGRSPSNGGAPTLLPWKRPHVPGAGKARVAQPRSAGGVSAWEGAGYPLEGKWMD
jgi:NADPH-dependent 2,4-dienoyl-CoA reductase/sulfur reductase-like enzyme